MKRNVQKTYGVSDRQIEIIDATLEGKDLNEKKLYLQITYLKPYLTDEELRVRSTTFERTTNLTTFQFQVHYLILIGCDIVSLPYVCSGPLHQGCIR